MVTDRLLARIEALFAPDAASSAAAVTVRDRTGAGTAPTGRSPSNPGGAPEPPAAPEDLRALVVDHGAAIYRFALSIVRDRMLAEDVAQDTLLRAWTALPTFRGEGSLRSWLLRITHNTAVSALRAQRATPVDPASADLSGTGPGGRSTNAGTDVEAAVEARLRLDAFGQALDELDGLSRQIVVLREVEDLPYDEIAALLGVSMPVVKTRLLRARKRLLVPLEAWR